MKVTDFASALNRYFNGYLVNDRGSSPRTIETYRYAFIQFLEYLEERNMNQPSKLQPKPPPILIKIDRKSVV